MSDHTIGEMDESFLNEIVNDSGIHNPYTASDQNLSYYSSPDKPKWVQVKRDRSMSGKTVPMYFILTDGMNPEMMFFPLI